MKKWNSNEEWLEDISKSLAKSDLESKLKSHSGVKSVSVEKNHPDHPGHSYISVEHTDSAMDHIDKHIAMHGKEVSASGPYKTDENHNGKSVYESQYIIKPHSKRSETNNSKPGGA